MRTRVRVKEMLRTAFRFRSSPSTSLATCGRPPVRAHSTSLVGAKHLIDARSAPSDFRPGDLFIQPDFLTQEEHDELVAQIDRKLRRTPYNECHFDHAIVGYRELNVSSWSADLDRVQTGAMHLNDLPIYLRPIARARALFPAGLRWLPTHILDLKEGGSILAHVDNKEYSGDIVMAINLLSPAKIRFRKEADPQKFVDMLALPRSVYFQRGEVRYNYTHEIINAEQSFMGAPVAKSRRISVIIRNEFTGTSKKSESS